jgi:hypothetical protein
MGINQSDDKAAKKDGIWNGNQTVWRAWEPECDRYLPWSLGVFAEASQGPAFILFWLHSGQVLLGASSDRLLKL